MLDKLIIFIVGIFIGSQLLIGLSQVLPHETKLYQDGHHKGYTACAADQAQVDYEEFQ